ncbi:hypothetical protein NtRootA9_06360 [Arthrobacter sp. NtRootA9]|nr:hypothetical protein NtRootA9_06360 [Arthrobacter sp. NtRootA9]
MDRSLHALVNLDVPADLVRIEVRGSLTHESRPDLVHIIRRVRRMGIRAHIRVDLSQAALVESAALAGLRADLNNMDALTLPGIYRSGVSLDLAGSYDELPAGPPADDRTSCDVTPLNVLDDDSHLTHGGAFGDEYPVAPDAALEELFGRELVEFSDEELLAASDALFALLDQPRAFPGADLLGRYNDIGRELGRRQPEPEAPSPAAEGKAAS